MVDNPMTLRDLRVQEGVSKANKTREYLIHHPNERVDTIAELLGVTIGTVYRVRKELVKEGILPASRKGSKIADEEQKTAIVLPEPIAEILSGGQLRSIGEIDELSGIEADEETINRMLAEIRKIAFSEVHPDTRLAAMQVWAKLKDISRVKELGPGRPLTKEGAIERLVLMFKAVGLELVISALEKAFNLEGGANAEKAAIEGGAPQASAEGASAPGSETTVRPIEGSSGEGRVE